MIINNMYDLLRFKNQVEASGIEFPQNLIIVSPEIIEEAVAVATNRPDTPLYDLQVFGVRVVRDFAEIIPNP